MSQDAAFLRAVIENPDDDNLRLVYADYLEESGRQERAAFIRVQCELASLPADDPRRPALEARDEALLKEHAKEWAGPLPAFVNRRWFRRGFVEGVEVEAEAFLAHAPELLASAPIREIQLASQWDQAGQALRRLSECPFLSRLKAIRLGFGCYQVGDDDLRTLASLPPLLERLDSLSVVECFVSPVGMTPLLMSPRLLRLRDLWLSECDFRGEEGVRPFTQSPYLPHLASLSLHASHLGDGGVVALVTSANCRRMKSLDLSRCEFTDIGTEAVAHSPHLDSLTVLWLNDNEIGDAGAVALAGATSLAKLEYLYLHRNRIGGRGAEALVTSRHLGRLRALTLVDNPISDLARARLKARSGGRVSF